MGRPRKFEKSQVVGIRLPDSIIEEVDQFLEKLKKENFGITISRNDALRRLIMIGLAKEKKGQAKE